LAEFNYNILNPLNYREFIVNTNNLHKSLLRHLLTNYPEISVYHLPNNIFRLEKEDIQFDLKFVTKEGVNHVQLQVVDSIADKFNEYLDSSAPQAFMYVYPKQDPLSLKVLEFIYETKNDQIIFHNLLSLIIDKNFEIQEKFFDDVSNEVYNQILSLLGYSSIASASVFILFYEMIDKYNVNNVLFLIGIHFIIFNSWKIVDKKIYFKDKI
tara:strand:+ start:834 stop:1466 length:633 start_codon:yes stop_codon:yes gene_type:complete